MMITRLEPALQQPAPVIVAFSLVTLWLIIASLSLRWMVGRHNGEEGTNVWRVSELVQCFVKALHLCFLIELYHSIYRQRKWGSEELSDTVKITWPKLLLMEPGGWAVSAL